MLETERLILRPLVRTDEQPLAALHAEPSFWHYPNRRGWTEEETRRFLDRTIGLHDQGGFAVTAVVQRTSGALMGWAGLSVPSFLPDLLPAVEVGWRLGQQFRGHGFATEAGAAWVDHGFEEHDLSEIVSIFGPENTNSSAVMRRLGFRHDHETVHPTMGARLHVTKLT